MKPIRQIYRGCWAFKPAPFIFLLLTMLLGTSPSSAHDGKKIKGIWVVRTEITTPEKINELISYASRFGYNTLFVQVRGRGDAYYKSGFVPGPNDNPEIPGEFDPLAYILKRVDGKGIEIHAWMNMNLTWSGPNIPRDDRHPAVKNKNWFVVSQTGLHHGTCDANLIPPHEAEGRFLSPASGEARKYLASTVAELLSNYRVDGIHLDYIRYPGSGYDFSRWMLDGFSSRWGKSIFEVVSGDLNNDPQLIWYNHWIDFRAEQITNIVEEIREFINNISPETRLSAAVKPDPDEAFLRFGQNWVGWIETGLVDFVVPMSYYTNTREFEDILDRTLRRTDRSKIVPGIGIYRLTPARAIEQINISIEKETKGFCLFSYIILITDKNYRNFVVK